MRKHLPGVALFAFIIASSAAVFAVLHIPPLPQLETPTLSTDGLIQLGPGSPNIHSKLHSLVVDHATGNVTAKVDLTWYGAGDPPKDLLLQIGAVTESEPLNARVVSSKLLRNVFINGKNIKKDLVIGDWDVSEALLDPNENYYAFIEVRDQFGPSAPGIRRDEQLADRIPVLFRHAD